MSAPLSRPGAVRRVWQAVALGLVAVLLSGCAGFSARVTIVPAHQAFDLDLIWAGRADQNGEEVRADCEALKKGGADATPSEHDGNILCELRMPVPLDDNQPFVRHENNLWTFHVTDKTLYEWLSKQIPSIKDQYPDGLKLDEFDDFYLRVDFPGPVVSFNGDGTVDGDSVIWKDAKPMFTPDGLQAESKDGHGWTYVAYAVLGAGLLLGLSGTVVGLFGSRLFRRRHSAWPPDHVVQWWRRNQQQWLAARSRPGEEPAPRR